MRDSSERALSRRKAIRIAALTGATGVAGCLGGEGSGQDQETTDGGGGGDDTGTDTPTEETFEMKVAHWLPPEHPLIQNGLNPLMEGTKENLSGTPYNVEFNVFPGGQLGGGSDMLRMAKERTADLTLTSPTYIEGKLTLSGVGALPLFQSGRNSSQALFEMIKEGGILFKEDFKPEGVRPVYFSNIAPYQVAGVGDRPVELSDFEGMKIRTPGGIQTEAMKKLGATTVTMEAADMVPAMERGTVQGTVTPIGSIEGHGWHETFEWGTTNASFGGFPFSFTTNLEYFNSLPSGVQDAMMTAGESASASGGQAYDDSAESFVEQEDEKSMNFYDVPEENLSTWNDQLSTLVEEWVADTKDKGYPAQKA
jgi:TRAP-type C4-dicarboxylate transport system substrate-binding protein